MTEEQKLQIADLREKGFGYATIAKALDLSKSTVTSHCQRNNLAGVKARQSTSDSPDKDYCKKCGKEINQVLGKKKMKFCSRNCRVTWWNANLDKVKRRAIYHFTCSYCGEAFTAYGNSKRKFCSHECYITSRFKGGETS